MNETATLIKHQQHQIQRAKNILLDRGAVAISLKYGETIELSCGVSIVLKNKRTGSGAVVVIIAPKDIKICRPDKEWRE